MEKIYEIRAARRIVSSYGEFEAGQVLATVVSSLLPGDLSAWVTFGQAEVKEIGEIPEEEAETAGLEAVEASRDVKDEKDRRDEEEEENQEPSPERSARPLPEGEVKEEEAAEHWADPLGLGEEITKHLDEADIRDIESLQKRIASGEPIKGIGKLRQEQIVKALEELSGGTTE